MFGAIELRLLKLARAIARVLAMTLVATLLLLGALAFLSLAGWLWLQAHLGPLMAALCLAGANLVGAGIALLLARTARPKAADRAAATASPSPAFDNADAAVPELVQAFFAGYRAGSGGAGGPERPD